MACKGVGAYYKVAGACLRKYGTLVTKFTQPQVHFLIFLIANQNIIYMHSHSTLIFNRRLTERPTPLLAVQR